MVRSLCYIVALGGAFAGATTARGQEEALAVPSGLSVHLQEVLLDIKPDGLFTYARFRFVVPAIGQGVGFDAVEADFPYLCETYALPALQEVAEPVDRIVVSYAEQAIEFGVSDPSVTQYFEAFRRQDDTCIWEGF